MLLSVFAAPYFLTTFRSAPARLVLFRFLHAGLAPYRLLPLRHPRPRLSSLAPCSAGPTSQEQHYHTPARWLTLCNGAVLPAALPASPPPLPLACLAPWHPAGEDTVIEAAGKMISVGSDGTIVISTGKATAANVPAATEVEYLTGEQGLQGLRQSPPSGLRSMAAPPRLPCPPPASLRSPRTSHDLLTCCV
ncbi:hypothetical protein ABPG75_003706 [Micractinium tetrahymenae]